MTDVLGEFINCPVCTLETGLTVQHAPPLCTDGKKCFARSEAAKEFVNADNVHI